MINVKDAGAVGDGVTNDWTVLQTLINNAGGALYFPPGRYRINSTLVFPDKTGHHWLGCGMAEQVPYSTAARGTESVIVWGGSAGGTMIEYRGTGLVWNGLGLWGCNLPGTSSSCPGTRAGTGLLLKLVGGRVATGKVWLGSLLVNDCDTAVVATNSADEVAFGYFWPQKCNVAFDVQHVNSRNFAFQYVHALDVGTVFKASNGGRIFTQAVRVLSDNTKVLDVSGGDAPGAFYHINGLALDDGVDNVTLLRNVASSSGTHHVRFTNGHFICSDTSLCPPDSSSGVSSNCHPVSVLIDRRNGTGQTMLELVGCRGVSALDDNVEIHGASSSNKSHLIVRECEIRQAGFLIDTVESADYTYAGIENWTFDCGVVPDDDGPD